ncbi:unnamed protein product [Scytosiphon promiscuus]
MLAWTALLTTVPGKCSGFHGALIPGRAGTNRLEKAAGRAASSACASSRLAARTGETHMSLSSDSILDGIFGGFRDTETTLPQDPDANPVARLRQLEKQRELYQWRMGGTPIDMPYLEGFPPDDELPTFEWLRKTAAVLVRILVGTVRGDVGALEAIDAARDPVKAKNFAQNVDELISDVTQKNERPAGIDDYNDLHAFPIKTPDALWDFDEDDAFARQRLQGANCVQIKKCSETTRNKLKILDTDSNYSSLKDKVDSLMVDGKLFVVDHELLAGLESSNYDDTARYLAPGIALFEATDDELLPLRAIGIQLDQGNDATPTPVFVPANGYSWQIAMACFEASDFIIHEVVSHLGNTHVVMEAPMVAMHRQLPTQHPIHALFAPHVEGTALINWGAHELLMPAGAGVDKLTAANIEDLWDIVREQTTKRLSSDFSPEADFEARGMTTEDFPGRYAYRDVGLKYWAAIHTWVTEYLDLYYPTVDEMDGDYELKAFMEELADVGGHTLLKGWVDVNDFTSKKALLAKYLASLVYTGSTLHAAVNFPQQPLTSYVPNTPGAVYQPIPADQGPRGFDEYLAFLPHLELATTQVVLTTLLGSVIYTKLGDYETAQFSDDRVLEPLQKFQLAIESIETELVDDNAFLTYSWKARGKDRKDAANFAYKTLLPDNVPQSINI